MPASKPPAEPDETAEGAPFLGEYLDETARTYHWPDGPQTVERGDVVVLPDGWMTDGRWHPSSRKGPTRLRDNHPDQRAKTAERQSKARTELHAKLAEPKGEH